jgi:hypothetical protein
MNYSINEFMGFTTIVVEIESTLPQYQQDAIVDILNDLSLTPDQPGCYSQPYQIINKHDEDIRIGHKFVILTNHNESTLNGEINCIIEIVKTGKLLTDTGYDYLTKYKEAAE